MTCNKTKASVRGEPLRQRVVDAAERLMRDDKADFSMRDLATAADVSFATPFNQFGSKAAIIQALSTRRIDAMEARFAAATLPTGAQERVLLAIEIAVAVMLEEPIVNRSVMEGLGSPSRSPGLVWTRSTALWTLALGTGEGLDANKREQALLCLPRQLAVGFRGILSFWTAGELPDDSVMPWALEVGRTLMMGFVAMPR